MKLRIMRVLDAILLWVILKVHHKVHSYVVVTDYLNGLREKGMCPDCPYETGFACKSCGASLV